MLYKSIHELRLGKSEFARKARKRMCLQHDVLQRDERTKMVFDLEMHLAVLCESLIFDSSKIFFDYATWTQQLIACKGKEPTGFEKCLQAIEIQLLETAEGDWISKAQQYITQAREQLHEELVMPDTYIESSKPYGNLALGYLKSCLKLRKGEATHKISMAIEEGASVQDIYAHVITPVLYEIGRLWHLNKISHGMEHYCTAVAQTVMTQIFPILFDGTEKTKKIAFTCVAGELHEIGARLVCDLFELQGWDSLFMGSDISAESVIDMVIQHGATVLGISVTLCSNLSVAFDLINEIRCHPRCDNLRIMVGGAGFDVDDQLWKKMGADGWARSSEEAIQLASTWGAQP